jgi:hypothetical protein
MKQIFLLLAIFSSATHAETILMQCGNELYRYTSGFLGITSPKYERREDADWKPFCRPIQGTNFRAVCVAGEQGMTEQHQILGEDGKWQIRRGTGTFIDFVTLEVKKNPFLIGKSGVEKCVRLTRG